MNQARSEAPPAPAADMASTRRDMRILKALNRRFNHNFVCNDVAAHDGLLHPEFRAVAPSGASVDRASYLRHWATGFDPAVQVYWDMRDEHIAVFGDTALVTASNRWIRVRDGVEVNGMTRYTDVYLRTRGRWLCVLAQMTPLAPEHFPPDDTVVVRYLRGRLELPGAPE